MEYAMPVTISKKPEVYKIRSFGNSSAWYVVDVAGRSCTCKAWQKELKCKHLEVLGVYPPPVWTPQAVPSFSQALSAFVKTIRLRREQEAIEWLLWLLSHDQSGGRFRVARRILIGSAEDGHSIAVMEKTASKFAELCRESTSTLYFAAEVVRICSISNWWDPASGGHDYIRCGMVSNRKAGLYHMGEKSLTEQLVALEKAIEEGSKVDALMELERIMIDKTLNRTALARHLEQLANKYKCEAAQRLTAIHLMHKTALSGDANFLCQAVWWMAGGSSPVVDAIQPVVAGPTIEKINAAVERMKSPPPMRTPTWACDGIHCAGDDRRFAGIWHDMMAVCNAFSHYGKMDPTAEWRREFYSTEGLYAERM